MRKLTLVMLLSCLVLVTSACGAGEEQGQGQEQEQVPNQATAPVPSASAAPAAPSSSSSDQAPPATAPLKTTTTAAQNGIEPVRVEITSIKVSADILPVGLDKQGRMDVPSDDAKVGWYSLGTNPGAPGRAVLSGHVDNKTGPAVFYNLRKLSAGDLVKVTGANGEELTFKVDRSESYPYDEAPVDEIFGVSATPQLILITCTGKYNRSKSTHEQRLVVYATIVS